MTSLALLAMLQAAAPLGAQSFDLYAGDETTGPERISGSISLTPPPCEAAGCGFALLRLWNLTEDPQRVKARLICSQYWDRQFVFQAEKTLLLDPGGRIEYFFPVPSGIYDHLASFQIENGPVRNVRVSLSAAMRQKAVLYVAGNNAFETAWATYLIPARSLEVYTSHPSLPAERVKSRQAKLVKGSVSQTTKEWLEQPFGTPLPSGITGEPPTVLTRPASDIPREWRHLSGFGLVILDCRDNTLSPEVEKCLLDYVTAGGRLILHFASALPAGPLAEKLLAERAPGPVSGTCGFGRFVAVADGSDPTGLLRRWLSENWEGKTVVPRAVRRGIFCLYNPRSILEIPGVGDVPVGAFFALILLFVLLAGPVNFLYCHFWRRNPRLLLLTIPATGFGFTLLILAYGFLGEGLDIKGVMFSTTLLDQKHHTLVQHVRRSLYAGIGPSYLSPQAETALIFSPLGTSGSGGHLRIDLDEGGRIPGSVLPSRTPTSLPSVTLGRARERIRFRKRADGGMDVLCAPDFHPAAGASLILRDFEGRWFKGDAEGPLIPLEEGEARRFAAGLVRLQGAWEFHVAPDEEDPPDWSEDQPKDHLETVLELTRGSYLTLVESVPSMDNLGLSVRYLREAHLLRGALAEEDILE